MSSSGVGPTPNRLGRYHLAEPLGGGPTGEVFRAKVYGVAGFERQFAVKRFHAAFVKDPATAEAIAAAARVYGGLEHPRITRLHEYGVTGGHAFTATELIDGLDLSRLLSQLHAHSQKLPHGGVAALISQIARTLGYAHGRGICHFGLCPTNLIVTTDGEARITDFGFLPPRLPRQPGADPSLYARVPYLAPEQLTHELTSAATDVFQLGALAYEMFIGKPAFGGANAQAVAQSILSGKLPAIALPKPLAAVLQRCLTRSPFERYPDARALADGMDAATRGLSLAGGLADIGQAVREVLEQSKIDDEGEMSGALSFPLPAPPRGDAMMDHLQSEDDLPATTIRDSSAPASAPSTPPIPVGVQSGRNAPTMTAPPLRPGARRLNMERLSGSVAVAVAEMDEEMPTVIRERERGFVRPTPVGIPVVEDVAALLDDDRDESGPNAIDTTVGADDAALSGAAEEHAPRPLTPAPPILPDPRLASPLPIPSLFDDAEELSDSHFEAVEDSERIALPVESSDAPRPRTPAPEPPATLVVSDSLAPSQAGEPRRRSSLPETLSDIGPAVRQSNTWEPLAPIARIDAGSGSGPGPVLRPTSRLNSDSTSGSVSGSASASGSGSMPGAGSRPDGQPRLKARARAHGKAGSKPGKGGAKWAVAVLLALVVAGGGYLAYDKFVAGTGDKPDESANRIAVATDGGPADPVADAGPPSPHDAGSPIVATATDAGADASTGIPPNQTPTDDGKLTIRSTPGGAKIYLDGAPIGKTPHTMDATADRHRLAIIRPGHKLYSADIEGRGLIEVTLQEAAPTDGPGGIKVRCSKKNRYVIFIDGEDTGQLCPSERIGVTVDAHVVEIYDPVTETRREFPANVVDTRHSLRIRVD